MTDHLARLKEILAEIHHLRSAAAILEWDQQTFMPPGGADDRAEAVGALSHIAHLKSTSDELGSTIDKLSNLAHNLDPQSDEFCLIRCARRDFERHRRVPARLVSEFSSLTSRAQHIWEKALHTNNFNIFKPSLERIFELRREYADCVAPYDHVYDPLLDEFEPGLKTADVLAIFRQLQPRQTALIKEIADRPQPDTSFLSLQYDEQKQWDFGVKVISKFGYDWKRGRQDRAVHPFTTTFGLGDVRITTRIFPDNLSSGLFSSMHEAGHAIYEQGISPALGHGPLATGASLAIHESQSRLWENLVGRSLDFWSWAYPELQKTFPAQLANVSLTQFHRAINRVQPSLIRVEADEATYNLHIMLRLELEIAVLEQRVKVAELPELWHEKMREYLGVTPDSDAKGVLQDVHWSCGIIGYFPTYALGNVISAQIWNRAEQEIPSLREQLRKGEFLELHDWLEDRLYRHGAKFTPAELVRKITGENINPAPYLAYLNDKFRGIYQ